MQFFFRGAPKQAVLSDPPPDMMEKAREDWAVARRYYRDGIFRSIWRMGNGVVAICEADSRDQLVSLLSELPMARAGLIDIDVQELSPYPGYAPELAN